MSARACSRRSPGLALALCLLLAGRATPARAGSAVISSAAPITGAAATAGTATAGSAAPLAVDVVERLNERLPDDARFFDAFQNQVAVRDIYGHGKPVLLSLVYFECPMLCSLVMQGLVRGLNGSGLELGKDYQAVTISFNPKDTPRESAVYQSGYLQKLVSARTAHAQDWLFLTGSAGAIHSVADAVGFKYRWDAASQQFDHPAVAVVLTPDGRISRYLYGVDFPSRDLKLALVEASGGKVGTSFDRVLLECFRYDPSTRRYGLYVWGFIRGGALLVLLLLGGMLFHFWRRDYRNAKASRARAGGKGPDGRPGGDSAGGPHAAPERTLS